MTRLLISQHSNLDCIVCQEFNERIPSTQRYNIKTQTQQWQNLAIYVNTFSRDFTSKSNSIVEYNGLAGIFNRLKRESILGVILLIITFSLKNNLTANENWNFEIYWQIYYGILYVASSLIL